MLQIMNCNDYLWLNLIPGDRSHYTEWKMQEIHTTVINSIFQLAKIILTTKQSTSVHPNSPR